MVVICLIWWVLLCFCDVGVDDDVDDDDNGDDCVDDDVDDDDNINDQTMIMMSMIKTKGMYSLKSKTE